MWPACWRFADARLTGARFVLCPDANPLCGNPAVANFPGAMIADVLHRDPTMADASHPGAMIADISRAAAVAADVQHSGAPLVAVAQPLCLPRPRDRNPPAS